LFITNNKTNKELAMHKKCSTRTSFRGEKVFIGIDVHKKTYTYSAWCWGMRVKVATAPAENRVFISSLKAWFSGAEIRSCYEAGFSGFKLHRDLLAAGIHNIVVNPASIEVAANDNKTDKRDSNKMGEQLAAGRLHGIYVPTEEEERSRLINRTREQFMKERNRTGHRIKSRLFQFGFIDKDDDRVMSENYLKGAEALDLPQELRYSLGLLISHWRFLSQQLEDIKIEMKAQSFTDSYCEAVYQSVPGIGDVSARILSNELGDLSKRFSNQGSLFKYVGLTPSEHSSGERQMKGNIDRQGAARLRKVLIECSWRAIDLDGVLKECFDRIASTRGKKRAIVAIARKLLGRIRACFVTKTEYCIGLVA
jgi:transposase